MDLTPQVNRLYRKTKIIGDPSGRYAGGAISESGKQFKVFEPRSELDLSPELTKRRGFKDFLYKKSGLSPKRPYMSENDISSKINSETNIEERGLWEHVFGDQARYEDRKHLSQKTQNAWKDALLKLRKNIDTEIRADLKSQTEEYDYKKGIADEELNAYDDYIKMFEKPKYTTKNIADYYGKCAYDKKGDFQKITKLQRATLDDMIANSDANFVFKEQEVSPAERTWFGDIGEPNIPAKRGEMLMPQQEQQSRQQYKTAEDVKAAYGSNELSKEEALELLKTQFGMR